MKSVKKIKWGLLAFVLACGVVFTGCPKATDDTPQSPVIEPNEDGDNDDKDDDAKAIAAGEEITINVGETVKVKAAGKSAAEFTQNGLTITHKGNGVFEINAAADMDDATVSVNFNDGTDTDDGIDVTVYVYNPYYTLNITLDDAIAEKAASISIYIEGKENGESIAALYQTVDAIYTAGQKTATAKLAKDKANSYKWYNNLAVTVKDADGNELTIEASPEYFCYTDENFTGITISAATESKIFTINFEGFAIPGGSISDITYATTWSENGSSYTADTAVTVKPVISEDGTSATFEVASTNEFYINWTAVVVKDKDGNEISLSAGNTDNNKWYGYTGETWSNTLTHVSGEYQTLVVDKSFSAAGDYVQVLEASDFSALSISTLKVIVKITSASGDWWASASAASSWVEATYQSLAWSTDDNGYAGVITGEDFISALGTNGLYLNVPSDAVGTVTVEYIAK